jgi:MFS family permease
MTTDERDEFGRPKVPLSWWRLLAVTAYWLAITVLWGAMTFTIIPLLVESAGVLGSPDHALVGLAIGVITTGGVIIAILVQPTMGAISDHTRSRLGRRKPYIIAGTLMDLAFLAFAAWAFWNQTYWPFVVAIALLQFSSNFAQGPYQGYVPDLVPSPQVGAASGLLGAANILGNIVGPGIAIAFVALASATGNDALVLGTFVVVGIIELVTMAITVIWVPDQPAPEPSALTLGERARAAWGTDILAQRDFVWIMISRLLVLTGLVTLQAFAYLYLRNVLGMTKSEALPASIPLLLATAGAALISAVPGAQISNRVGRKPVLFVAIGSGIVGGLLLAFTGSYAVVIVGAVFIGVCSGVFLGVDWALMTDIIPKAESGRYMGISNIAVAGAGPLATTIGGILTFVLGGVLALNSDIAWRGVFVLLAVELLLGALALRNVTEPPRAGQAAAEMAGPVGS